jgi:ribosomal protein S1
LAELQRAGVTEAPTALFSMHQVLKVRVVSCDVERRRIVVCEASAPVRDAKTKSITSEQSSKHKAGEVVRGAKIVGIEGEGDAAVVQVDLRYRHLISLIIIAL